MIDSLLQASHLPNLHPALVHFPIAALPLALGFELLGVVWIRRRWLANAATTLYAFAALGAWLALWAGEEAADGLTSLAAQVQPHIGEHSDWGHYAFFAMLAFAALRAGLHFAAKTKDRRDARVVALALGVIALGVLVKTADLGGALVYRYGVGVEPGAVATVSPPAEPVAADPNGATEALDRLIRQDDGGWLWRPQPGDRDALGTVLRAEPGSSLDRVRWAETDASAGLTLDIEAPVTLLLPGAFSDVQVEARVQLPDWDGAIGIVHHVRDHRDLGTFTLSTRGIGVLADVREGKLEILDQETVPWPGSELAIAVSSAGKHLKGLVDGATVTHGHVEPGPGSACGLVFDGVGRVRIVEVRVIPLGPAPPRADDEGAK